MIIKCGRIEFEVNSNDVIMYNGACYQLMTRTVGTGWNESTPILAKGKAEQMIKKGELILFKKGESPRINSELEYYKFNV